MSERIALPALPLELKRLTGKPSPGYQPLRYAMIEGQIPAERAENGRWSVARADLPTIAVPLGLLSAPALAPAASAA